MGVLTAFAAARRAFVGHFQAKQAPTVTLAGGGIARLMGDRFRDFAEEGYQRNVVVYRAVNLIAEGAAAISFKLFERDSLVVDGHPLLGLLARPAPLLSGVELFTALYAYRLIDGNAFLLRTGPNVGPRASSMCCAPTASRSGPARSRCRAPTNTSSTAARSTSFRSTRGAASRR